MEELLEHEKRHIGFLEENAHEGTLFLKRNGEFPLDKPCRCVLVGNGARCTIKGGTGSGDVASRFFVSFEKEMEAAGFEITSKEWMDKYDAYKKTTWNGFVKETKKQASKNHIFAGMYSMGYFEEEKNYEFSPEYEGDIAVYVLARNSGEGNDRRNIPGDVKLSEREIKDILYLAGKFRKFMLVLNVGGVVDLSPVVNEVGNILYISQLGVVTGKILPEILLGRLNPSGKLTSSWAKPEDYPCFSEFGGLDDTYYKEGIYVGYRYFDTVKRKPLFPFGYGLSYTDFEASDVRADISGTEITISAKIRNTGKYPGKEVLEVYVSAPQGSLGKPYQILAGYGKTSLLNPSHEENVSVSFDVASLASYDEKASSYVLEKGSYIIRCGNSSDNTIPVAFFNLDSDTVTRRCENKIGNPGFKPEVLPLSDSDTDGLLYLNLDASLIHPESISYHKDCHTEPEVLKMTEDELILLCLGNHKSGRGAVVGNSAVHVIGGAGETTLGIPSLKDSLTMADGPAGLRLKQTYGVDEKGVYDVSVDPIMEKMFYFLPGFVVHFMKPPKNRHGEIHHQYTTAIPIGTSLAMSWNREYLESIGKLIAEEMEIFNVDLWLAPALNIHRSILCGRNFEYYSEDPLVSGLTAACITRGVQSHKGRGVTIKHFCCNNQELDRNNNNSHVSERAFREIYIRGFEICVKEARPKAIMTSYNLVNGIHTSESYPIVNDILRCEWNYEGLIMTDWITSGISWYRRHKYPAPYADNNILAGNDLTMAGTKRDEKYIAKALKKKKLTKDDLIYSASRIYRIIKEMKS